MRYMLCEIMSTLYRKYRPKDFSEVVGQNHIKITLENEIATGTAAHAYLFCGPRAVGKTTFARILAKAVNCQERKEGEFEPCNKCSSCQEIDQFRSLDIIEIDAASHTGVDNVRENIIAGARVAPSSSKYKVFIIDEVHMLSISAFNALLKILEEPPAKVIFILCTTEAHKVPSTIISRCQRFDFKRIGIADMVKKLKYIIGKEKIKAEPKILEAIARQADGHMRDAESLLGQIMAIAGEEISEEEVNLVIPRSDIIEAMSLIEFLQRKDMSGGIELVNKLLADGVDLERFTTDLIEVLRKMLLAKANPVLGERLAMDFGESAEAKLTELVGKFDLGRLIITIERFIRAKQEIKSSFIVQLPLELALAELCSDSGVKAQTQSPRPAQSAPQAQTAPKEQAPPVNKVSGNMNKQDLSARWNEFLAKVKKYNHSLSFVLRVCEPRGIDGNKVCLAFKYKFHKDRINEANIKVLVEKTLAEVYGRDLIVEAILDEAIESPDNANSNSSEENTAGPAPEQPASPGGGDDKMMQDLLSTFGGKVVG
ncbi:DNA polymerase III subunit gamma/tau [Candidatus Falkowbacteria bacterium]|nr:DNA polymerase III subunit gamma/tau [Candidatus Falkowbacteria bacterium]